MNKNIYIKSDWW